VTVARRASKTDPDKGRRKRGRKPVLDPVAVSAALVRHGGNLSAVARQFRVTRQSVLGLIAATPTLKDVLGDAREGMTDDAESALMAAIRKGASWAVLFYLKTQAQDRGYGEKPKVVHVGKGRLEVTEVIVRNRAEAVAILALNRAEAVPNEPWAAGSEEPLVPLTAHAQEVQVEDK
jgi:hypothetical protein